MDQGHFYDLKINYTQCPGCFLAFLERSMKINRYVAILVTFIALTTCANAQLTNVRTVLSGWCEGQGNYYKYEWKYTDAVGVHAFPNPTYTFLTYTTGGARTNIVCQGHSTSAKEFSTDGAYYMTATGGNGSASAAAMGFINPKYVVVGVTYAPPGSSSSVQYTNTTSVGSTTTISNSFTSGVGFSVSVSHSFGMPAAGTNPTSGGVTSHRHCVHRLHAEIKHLHHQYHQQGVYDFKDNSGNPYSVPGK